MPHVIQFLFVFPQIELSTLLGLVPAILTSLSDEALIWKCLQQHAHNIEFGIIINKY